MPPASRAVNLRDYAAAAKNNDRAGNGEEGVESGSKQRIGERRASRPSAGTPGFHFNLLLQLTASSWQPSAALEASSDSRRPSNLFPESDYWDRRATPTQTTNKTSADRAARSVPSRTWFRRCSELWRLTSPRRPSNS